MPIPSTRRRSIQELTSTTPDRWCPTSNTLDAMRTKVSTRLHSPARWAASCLRGHHQKQHSEVQHCFSGHVRCRQQGIPKKATCWRGKEVAHAHLSHPCNKYRSCTACSRSASLL